MKVNGPREVLGGLYWSVWGPHSGLHGSGQTMIYYLQLEIRNEVRIPTLSSLLAHDAFIE